MPGEGRKVLRKITGCFTAASAICVLDQVSKHLAVKTMRQGDSYPLIKGMFHLTFVRNTGAAFGMLSGSPGLFVPVSAVSILLLIFLLTAKIKRLTSTERAALALILGGAVGNLIDRVRLGYVIDLFDFRVWPVFNIADSAISIGAVLLMIAIVRGEKKGPEYEEKTAR
ncbi:MAG: signal peptidase II [Candidatus Omnitrophota bacterium]|nr:signal peptidase II [Candidatus Omnitrophota bacterium]